MLQFFLSSPIDGMSYYIWLNKPIKASLSDGNYMAPFYLLFPSLWIENKINRNAYPTKLECIKKCLLHIAFYPLTVILINAIAKNLFITDSFKDIFQNKGFFGFFSGLPYQLLMQSLLVFQNYFFIENEHVDNFRMGVWIIFQIINVPLQILFSSLRLKSISGISELLNIGSGWLFGLVSQCIKQFNSLKQELVKAKDPRARKFIGG
ncbi:unnamed protein product [Paramecium sonneborni]|uniref:Uncharacterized protein n=1 Tax=Paramecium sonneborni TaxID=65129 RepID=A0A8S1K5J8_9CILI|nr:unnamed protein product [Paramecium sonneborni]